MQDWLSLDRRPAFVFGAGGLGGASALSLAAQGARVALADTSQDNLDAVGQAAKDLAERDPDADRGSAHRGRLPRRRPGSN